MTTREELIGRKFNTIHDSNVYSIEDGTNGMFSIRWTKNTQPNFIYNIYHLEDINRFLRDKIWTLIEEPVKQETVYKSPKGVEFEEGTQFDAMNPGNTHYLLKIESGNVHIKRVGDTSDSVGVHLISWFTNLLDTGEYKILMKQETTPKLDFKSVDPTTIKFDFENTRIPTLSKEEYDWVYDAVVAKGYEFRGDKIPYNVGHVEQLYVGGGNHNDKSVGWARNGWVSERGYKLITIQDILNNQDMSKQVIEVGDVVGLNINMARQYTVESITGTKLTFTEGGWDNLENVTLVTKGAKQEIIGYELLKDLPNVKAGTVSNTHNPGFYGFALTKPRGSLTNLAVHEDDVKDTTWFKPMYKAKEESLTFSKYKATLSKEHGLVFTDNERISFSVLSKLISELTSKESVGLGSHDGHAVTVKFDITSVQVGCKAFNKADVELVSAALKSLK